MEVGFGVAPIPECDSDVALDTLRSLQPELPWPHLIAGKALLETGKPRDAIAALERSLGTNPFDPSVHCTLAEAYQKVPPDPQINVRRERADRHCKELGKP